jgi:hypothetical protein
MGGAPSSSAPGPPACAGHDAVADLGEPAERARFRTHCQTHAFSSANPRKPAFPCIDPTNCKTFLRSRPHVLTMKIDEVLYELERVWEAGSLPGRQAAEFNAALRALWRDLAQEPPARRS